MVNLPDITEAPKFELPLWKDVSEKRKQFGEESLDPIELFVYRYELSAPKDISFREDLLNLCNELYKP